MRKPPSLTVKKRKPPVDALKGKPSHARMALPKKKMGPTELSAIYGVKVKFWRYRGLKGIYWNLVSEYVRKRDAKLWGRCISCETRMTDWQSGDAGHFVSASKGGFGLLFDLLNVHLQCKKCNNPMWSPDSSIAYGFELDRRYGKGTAEGLWARRNAYTKEWSPLEYDRNIRALQGALALL